MIMTRDAMRNTQPLKDQARAARDLIRKNVEYSLLEEDESELMPPPPPKNKQSLERKMRARTTDYGDDGVSIRTERNPRPRAWQEDVEDPRVEEERAKVNNIWSIVLVPQVVTALESFVLANRRLTERRTEQRRRSSRLDCILETKSEQENLPKRNSAKQNRRKTEDGMKQHHKTTKTWSRNYESLHGRSISSRERTRRLPN